jgi:hypothetical protein
MVLPFLMLESRSGFQYGVNAKIIRRIIGKFADSWDLDLMSFSLKKMMEI